MYSTPLTTQESDALTQMMVSVVENGTGKAAQIPGVTVAGKTGTAETGHDTAPHAWFVGFAPAENPVIAVAVIVENGGDLGSEATGGRVAAPIAKAVMQKAIELAGRRRADHDDARGHDARRTVHARLPHRGWRHGRGVEGGRRRPRSAPSRSRCSRTRRHGNETFLRRFRNEAKNAAGLAHPNIAQVFDYGDHDGIAFLVMEFVDGEPLSSILETRAHHLRGARSCTS